MASIEYSPVDFIDLEENWQEHYGKGRKIILSATLSLSAYIYTRYLMIPCAKI